MPVLARLREASWPLLVEPQMTQKFDYAFYFAPAVPHDYDALLDRIRRELEPVGDRR